VRILDLDKWNEIWSVLKKNKLRTFFTAFGVFWGIFMLVIMMGSGRGLENGVSQGMGDIATNSFFMWTQRTTMPYKGFPRGGFYNFRNDDTEALKQNIPEIDLIAPKLQAGGFRAGGNNVVRGERTGAFEIFGDVPEYNQINPLNILQGRFLNHLDIDEQRKVIVIGDRVKQEMFNADENPLGEYLRIQGVYFKVIGVVSSKMQGDGGDRDNRGVFMPFPTLQRTYNYGDIVGWYSITSVPGVPASVVEEKAKALIRERHHIHPDDTRAVGSWNMEKEYKKMTGLFAGIKVLIWIVGIGTLFAGIVGVSNIMLIVVKERTKEIGIQRAIGAPPSVIISQIIIESVFLTTVAGYFGLVAGVGILELVNSLLISSGADTQMFSHPEIDFQMAMTSLVILIIAGALAGMIPAKRAVDIRPIEALRDE
jgi:putative ABC transport system permease protein